MNWSSVREITAISIFMGFFYLQAATWRPVPKLTVDDFPNGTWRVCITCPTGWHARAFVRAGFGTKEQTIEDLSKGTCVKGDGPGEWATK